MQGVRDTKKSHIISMLKETHDLEGRQIHNYNIRNVTPRYSNIVYKEYNESMKDANEKTS